MTATTRNLEEEKARFAHDMLLIGGISYWGDWEPNYGDDQIDPDYDTIPETYTITDRNDEFPGEEPESKVFTPVELAEKFYDCAMYLIEENKKDNRINRYFMEWAANVVTYNLDEAPTCDALMADYAVQYAMFGRQMYA